MNATSYMHIMTSVQPLFLMHTVPTFLDAWESKELDQSKVVAGDDGLVIKRGVGGIDVVHLSVLWPDAVDL